MRLKIAERKRERMGKRQESKRVKGWAKGRRAAERADEAKGRRAEEWADEARGSRAEEWADEAKNGQQM